MSTVTTSGMSPEAEAALRESEERFSKIFNAASTMLAFTEPGNGKIIDVNAAWLRGSGWKREDVVGKTGGELRLWGKPEARSAILSELESKNRVVDAATELVIGEKSFPALLSAEYIEMRGKQYILWELRDISERRRAEREQDELRSQLLQAQKMETVGQLAGGIAHDFNNILSAILGFTNLALEGLDNDVSRGFLEQVLRAGERASALTRQLLTFSRKQVIEPRVIDPATILREMEPMLRRLIGEHLELVLPASTDSGLIKVDVAHLEHAVMNLVVNARDAMPNGGKVTLETSNVVIDEAYIATHLEARPGPYVMIAVSDTGVGMDELVRRHAFEPFFTTKGPARGTGLGLSTVYGIVKQSGGWIWLYSEPGNGTTFKLYFPRTLEEPQREVDGPAPKAPPAEGTTVLLVEDEPQLRVLVRTILERAGYRVRVAADPLEALAISEAHEGEIHLLLTDVLMPHMNGKVLADKLTQTRGRQQTRVLYMSGYTENTIVHQGVVDSGVNFLSKPITQDRLLAKVASVLGS